MGTSSNAPKETKCADGKDEHGSLGKPVIWAGMFLTNKLNPVIMSRQSKMTEYMECTSCELRKAIVKRIPDLGINEKCSRHW